MCSNDAFDAETGVDQNKAESLVNLTGNRKVILALANGFLLFGGLLLHSVTKAAVRSQLSAVHTEAFHTASLFSGLITRAA